MYDSDISLLGVLEAFEYLNWTRRYSECGSFKLKAPAIPQNLALLSIGNILWKSDDEEAGIIETIELTQDEEETIEVSGRFGTSLLTQRIIWGTETISDEFSTCVGQLLSRHAIAPTNTDRVIPQLFFSGTATGVTVESQVSYKNLLTTVQTLCNAADIGIKTVFSPTQRRWTVTLYEGLPSQAIFSREYENLLEQEYTHSRRDYANVALVGGEGEGSARALVTTGSGAGLARYELFVDAKDLKSEDFPSTYTTALSQRGQSKLAERKEFNTFDATINAFGNLEYKTDYDLGSIVTILSKAWGVTQNSRITEIEETYDVDGRELRVTFGRGVLTLTKKLKGE